MDNARDDLRAIDAATDVLVRGLNRSDISSIADLVTDKTLVLAPARKNAKGQAVIEYWRKMAMANEGIRMLSLDVDTLAPGLIRDCGTLSMRQKQNGEQVLFRYVMLWQKTGEAWTLATMTWNREPPTGGRRPGGDGAGAGGEM